MIRIACLRHDARLCVSVILCLCFVGVASTAQPPAKLNPSTPTEAGLGKGSQKVSVKGTVEKAHTPTDLPKWDGFRGIKWGTDIKTLTGFDLKEMTPWKEGTYFRKKEEMTLGGAKLKEVQWLFYEGQLFQVGIITPDAGAFKALKRAAEERYGKNYQNFSHGELESYTWTGITSDGKKVRLEMSGSEGLYTFFFVYTPIDEKLGQALDAYNTDAYIKTEAKKKQADEAAEKARSEKKQADEAAEMARSKKEAW